SFAELRRDREGAPAPEPDAELPMAATSTPESTPTPGSTPTSKPESAPTSKPESTPEPVADAPDAFDAAPTPAAPVGPVDIDDVIVAWAEVLPELPPATRAAVREAQ